MELVQENIFIRLPIPLIVFMGIYDVNLTPVALHINKRVLTLHLYAYADLMLEFEFNLMLFIGNLKNHPIQVQ